MNIYRIATTERMWDAETEYFVAADDQHEALNLCHAAIRGDEPNYSNAADPEAYKKAHLEYLAYLMDAFKEAELFAIALPGTEKGVIHSVFTPG